jgi:hypothetical protein
MSPQQWTWTAPARSHNIAEGGERHTHAGQHTCERSIAGVCSSLSHIRVAVHPAPTPPARAQATLQAMTDPNAAGGANVFLGALVSGIAALNGARAHAKALHRLLCTTFPSRPRRGLALTCAVSLIGP